MAKFIREDAVATLRTSPAVRGTGLICKGSAGAGNFATVPWLALFDPLVTTTARDGYYLVFLYSGAGDLHLSLNQGTTAVRREFGRDARAVLRDRASFMRARLHDFKGSLPADEIFLASDHQLPRDYEAGHAIGCTYTRAGQIDGDRLIGDIATAIDAYRSLTFRGGLDPSPDAATGAGDDLLGDLPMSLEEIRRYRYHRRIERNPKAAELAKFAHGTNCQACGFSFKASYGALGEGFIEAHHLRPLGSLEENIRVDLDAMEDFAVLCSNCHRMIHRLDDPSDLSALTSLLRNRRG